MSQHHNKTTFAFKKNHATYDVWWSIVGYDISRKLSIIIFRTCWSVSAVESVLESCVCVEPVSSSHPISGGGGGGQRRRLCKNLRSLSVCESESGERASESGERGEGESVYVRVHRPLLQFQTAGETANLRHGLKNGRRFIIG